MNPVLRSFDPATGRPVWEGPAASAEDAHRAVERARGALADWAAVPYDERVALVRGYAEAVDRRRHELVDAICAETGKPRWEASTEVDAVIAKVEVSIAAHDDRTPDRDLPGARLRHRPLGVLVVLGPFNLPAHLPNGQIVPALLAGDTVVWKPSELAPSVAGVLRAAWDDAGLPRHVLQIVHGGPGTGSALVAADIDGVAFIGSRRVGVAIHRALAGRPEVMVALEMGGNNPLVVADVPDLAGTIDLVARSAFLTTGQRCTCARRLIVVDGPDTDRLVDALVEVTRAIVVDAPDAEPEPFAGPLITPAAADRTRASVAALGARGARILVGPGDPRPGTGFVRPTLIAVDEPDLLPDEELFAPVLTLVRVPDPDTAAEVAAATRYGLAAGIVTASPELFETFARRIPAGIVNWNTPTTGASGRLPFGGVGWSGNHRPAGWTTADHVADPVVSSLRPRPEPPSAPLPGLPSPAESPRPTDPATP